MDRRSFFRFFAAAPVAVATARPDLPGFAASYRRLSSESGDPGERAWAELAADGIYPKVYLDGVEQDLACTADVDLGMIRRAAKSPQGRLLMGADEQVMIETVYGRVDIRIESDRLYGQHGRYIDDDRFAMLI